MRRERGGGKKEEEKSGGKGREEGRYGREEKRRVWEGERERKECRESKGELHVRGWEAECCVALAGIALRTYPLRLQHFSQGALLRVLGCRQHQSVLLNLKQDGAEGSQQNYTSLVVIQEDRKTAGEARETEGEGEMRK